MNYYDKLRNIREDLDLSRREVAEAIGTTHQQIYKYEKGLQEMTITRFAELCIYYNVSADEILGIKPKQGSKDLRMF